MEGRLLALAGAAPPSVTSAGNGAPAGQEENGVVARGGEPSAPAEEGAPPVRDESEPAAWPDEAAETAFLAETRDRGEAPSSVKVREETVAETDAGPLPALEDLVQQIPADVRTALDDLFRARFVRVTRVPRNALKG